MGFRVSCTSKLAVIFLLNYLLTGLLLKLSLLVRLFTLEESMEGDLGEKMVKIELTYREHVGQPLVTIIINMVMISLTFVSIFTLIFDLRNDMENQEKEAADDKPEEVYERLVEKI
jgi:hypothetical protein